MEPKDSITEQPETLQSSTMQHERVIQPLPSTTPPLPPVDSLPEAVAAPVAALPTVPVAQPVAAPIPPAESFAVPVSVAPAPPTFTTPPPEVAPNPVFQPATQPYGQPVTGIVSGSGGLVADGPPIDFNKKRSFVKPMLVSLGVLGVIGIGTAAAFVGIIIPNKPENVLKSALLNSVQAQYANYDGTINASSSGAAYKIAFTGNSDAVAKAADVKLSVTVSGVPLTFDAKLVKKNVYVKVGDLKTIESLVGAIDPSLATLTQKVNEQVANKWIVIDSTLLDQAGVSCAIDSSVTLTKNDIKLLEQAYAKHPFTTIKKTSSDSAGKKMELSIDNDKIADFSGTPSLDQLSFVKTLNKCDKNATKSSNDTKAIGNHKKTPITVWVKDKHITQIGYDYDESGNKVNVLVKLSYNKARITAPEGAVPIAQVVATLQSTLGSGDSLGISDLLGGLVAGPGGQQQAKDSKRETDLSSIQTHLEAYYSDNGFYPSLAQMNDPKFVTVKLNGFDPTALSDPDSANGSQQLAAAPAPKVYAYQVTDAAKKSCEAKPTTCALYTLTATLETAVNGSNSYVKQSLN